MHLLHKRIQTFVYFIVCVLPFSACTKIVSTELGGDLIPAVDGVNTKEMFLDVVSKNVKDSATRVGVADLHSLGYVNDPLFGQTSAAINVQLKPTTFPFYFPASKENLFLDSVVLVLGCHGVWGDSTQNLSLHVYEIDPESGLKFDTVYPTDYNVPHLGELTNGAQTVDVTKIDDSVHPFQEDAANQLRLHLSNDFGNRLLYDYDTTLGSAYHSDSVFNFFLKGFQIVPEQTGNSLVKVSLLDTNTKLAIYFRFRDTAGNMDTALRYFRCNQYSSISSNFITRNRTSSQASQWLPPANSTSTNDSLIFVDANPGIFAQLQIPGLDTIQNKIIHRAEIIMEEVPDVTHPEDHYFTAPDLFIAPYSQDSMARFALPNDVLFGTGYVSNQSSLGCNPLTKTDPLTGQTIAAYNFDISRYVQGIITRHEKSYPLVLYAPSVRDYIRLTETSLSYVFTGVIGADGTYVPLNAPACGRVRVGGGSNAVHRMRVHIIYSDL